jgi:hypothetical protein
MCWLAKKDFSLNVQVLKDQSKLLYFFEAFYVMENTAKNEFRIAETLL